MTLKEYAETINNLLGKYGNLEVWYAKDDEGNGYQPIYYAPSVFDIPAEFSKDNKTVIVIN